MLSTFFLNCFCSRSLSLFVCGLSSIRAKCSGPTHNQNADLFKMYCNFGNVVVEYLVFYLHNRDCCFHRFNKDRLLQRIQHLSSSSYIHEHSTLFRHILIALIRFVSFCFVQLLKLCGIWNDIIDKKKTQKKTCIKTQFLRLKMMEKNTHETHSNNLMERKTNGIFKINCIFEIRVQKR